MSCLFYMVSTQSFTLCYLWVFVDTFYQVKEIPISSLLCFYRESVDFIKCVFFLASMEMIMFLLIGYITLMLVSE